MQLLDVCLSLTLQLRGVVRGSIDPEWLKGANTSENPLMFGGAEYASTSGVLA